ncbi:MAG: YqiA/YcfP family alpha/beta fold hydrolase [Bryobacteraceae bacterium]
MTVIYLHGFASGPGSKKAGWFREKFRECGVEILIPDLAEGDFERLTIGGQLAVIERVAEGRRVGLIGSSMGGYLAALYAARHPETEWLVLLAPAFRFAGRWAASLGERKLEEWRGTGYLEFYHYGEKGPRRLSYELLREASKYEDFPEITQPTTIFHGRRDDVVPYEYSVEFADGRPNVELHLLESNHELLDVLDEIWGRIKK